MPKHYRPAGKKKDGNAAKYVTRSQAVKYLQVSLPVFRKLCILKGVFPREPKKKVKGNHHSYYHMKDITFLKHEPLLEKLRDIRAYDKKEKKAMSKKNRDLAERLLTRKPTYTLDMLIKESMVHLFAALPAVDRAVDGEKIPVSRVYNCRRLSHEWQAYISHKHKLRKTFISVKGIYYQAEVEGQKVTWLTLHALQQVLPEVDYRILLTFLEFYETLLAFLNYKLYHSINVKYPPIRLEALAADLYALSRYFDSNAQSSSMTLKAIASPCSNETEPQQDGEKLDESELRLAQLQHQIPSNEAGALMHLVEDASREDEEDVETLECKILFKNMKFFSSREVPRSHCCLSSLLLVAQFLGKVMELRLRSLTRASLTSVPLPHLSPFVDNEAEGHVPEYAEAIRQLKAAEREEVLPLPGMGNEDLDDPQSLLGIIDRAEAIEAAKKKRKMLMQEKQYHEELKLALQGAQYSAVSSDVDKDVEGDALADLLQAAKDDDNLLKTVMPRKKQKLLKAMEEGKKRKQDRVNQLKERQKKIKMGEAKSTA